MRDDTKAVRAGLRRSNFDETAEALFLTSGFVYDTAEDAEATFNEEFDHYIYSRYDNPTIRTFEQRMAALEGAEACLATASGMAAVWNALAASVGSGDRIVASRNLFGSNTVILNEILPRWGVDTTFVDGTDLEAWAAALREPSRVVFFETPSNPMQELVDAAAVADLAHAAGARVIADNVFATPVLQSPLELGVDVVVYSTTKHIDGQGRVLGGAILSSKEFIDGPVRTLMRHTGPSMSPFNAWVLTKSLETLRLRVTHSTATALELAAWLETQPGVTRVRYPWLRSHPQYDLATRQMSGGGTVVTIDIDGDKVSAFRFMNSLSLVDISNNLGDSKSLITHPATTTHKRVGAAAREAAGITDGTVRLSIGLEDVEDLREDLDRALQAR